MMLSYTSMKQTVEFREPATKLPRRIWKSIDAKRASKLLSMALVTAMLLALVTLLTGFLSKISKHKASTDLNGP